MNIQELFDILQLDKPSDELKKREKELFELIPELVPSKGKDQKSIWHVYDVLEHIYHVVDGVPNNLVLRVAALFHDIGKPYVMTVDENGHGHFYNHPNKSKEIFEKFARRNNLDDDFTKLVSLLIEYHDCHVEKMSLEKLNKLFDGDSIRMLFALKRSDLLAQNEEFHYMINSYNKDEQEILKKVKK